MRVVAYVVMAVALATLLLWLPVLAHARPILAAMRPSDVAILFYPLWLLVWLGFALRSVRSGHSINAIVLAVVGMVPMLLSAAGVWILSHSLSLDGAT